MPSNFAAAPILTCQSFLASRFFSFLPRKAFVQAWSRASLAALSFDFLPHLNPFVYLRIFSRFLWAIVPRFTRVMFLYLNLFLHAFEITFVESSIRFFSKFLTATLFCLEMGYAHWSADNFSISGYPNSTF